MTPNIKTVRQMVERHPAFTEGGLRWDVFRAEENGLAEMGAILRKGRRLYIDEDRYFAWLRSQQNVPLHEEDAVA